jgi:hypothetical protein
MAEGLLHGAENSLFVALLKNSLFGALRRANEPEKESLGDWSDGGTPGHIPNPVVKAVSADGTWGAAPWESRSLPRDFSIFYLYIQPFRPLTGYRRAAKIQPA